MDQKLKSSAESPPLVSYAVSSWCSGCSGCIGVAGKAARRDTAMSQQGLRFSQAVTFSQAVAFSQTIAFGCILRAKNPKPSVKFVSPQHLPRLGDLTCGKY